MTCKHVSLVWEACDQTLGVRCEDCRALIRWGQASGLQGRSFGIPTRPGDVRRRLELPDINRTSPASSSSPPSAPTSPSW